MVQEFSDKVYDAVRRSVVGDPLQPLNPLQRIFGFLRFVVMRFVRTRGMQVAGSLTCTTLLALVPFITIALTVLTALPGFNRLLPKIRDFLLANLLPDTASRIIGTYMTHFSNNAGNLRLAGTLLLALATITAMMTVDKVFGDIWQVKAQRPLVRRLLTYALLVLLAPVAVTLALTVSTTLFKVWMGYGDHGLSWIPQILLTWTPWLAISTTLTMMYRSLPYPHVPMKHAITGGLMGGLAFEVMRWLFTFYVHHFPGYTAVYGAFAAFPIFLLWIYLSWSVVLGGAVLTASFSYWNGDAWRISHDHPDQQFRDALQVLRVLMLAGERAIRLPELQGKLAMGYDNLETAILPLVAAGLVAEDRYGYCRAKPPVWQATLGDVWVLFHRGPLAGGQWSGDQILGEVAELLDALPSKHLCQPLRVILKET
jgi:membrane protein